MDCDLAQGFGLHLPVPACSEICPGRSGSVMDEDQKHKEKDTKSPSNSNVTVEQGGTERRKSLAETFSTHLSHAGRKMLELLYSRNLLQTSPSHHVPPS